MTHEVDIPMWGIKEINGRYYRRVPFMSDYGHEDGTSWQRVNFDDVAW